MTARHLQSPASLTPSGDAGPTPTPLRKGLARGGVGPGTPPGAGRATTAEVEGADDAATSPRVRAIPRRSWALVDGAGRRLREGSVLFLLALFVAAPSVALGLAFALVAARRGVAW